MRALSLFCLLIVPAYCLQIALWVDQACGDNYTGGDDDDYACSSDEVTFGDCCSVETNAPQRWKYYTSASFNIQGDPYDPTYTIYGFSAGEDDDTGCTGSIVASQSIDSGAQDDPDTQTCAQSLYYRSISGASVSGDPNYDPNTTYKQKRGSFPIRKTVNADSWATRRDGHVYTLLFNSPAGKVYETFRRNATSQEKTDYIVSNADSSWQIRGTTRI